MFRWVIRRGRDLVDWVKEVNASSEKASRQAEEATRLLNARFSWAPKRKHVECEYRVVGKEVK